MTSFVAPEIIVMADIESLDIGPRSIVTQVGLVFVLASDPETSIKEIEVNLPIQPQQVLKRTINPNTIKWWMTQPDAARAKFMSNDSEDFDELVSWMNYLNRQFTTIVGDQPYELWARGPQFDVVNIESLMLDCAVSPAWKYDKIRDLRTFMALAGLSSRDIVRPDDLPAHDAVNDCKFQLLCYAEAQKHLRARS